MADSGMSKNNTITIPESETMPILESEINVLKKFLSTQLLCRIEYEAGAYIALNGTGEFIVQSYRWDYSVPSIAPETQTIAIAEKWLTEKIRAFAGIKIWLNKSSEFDNHSVGIRIWFSSDSGPPDYQGFHETLIHALIAAYEYVGIINPKLIGD